MIRLVVQAAPTTAIKSVFALNVALLGVSSFFINDLLTALICAGIYGHNFSRCATDLQHYAQIMREGRKRGEIIDA